MFGVILFTLVLYRVEAICKWPCPWQERGRYTQILGRYPDVISKYSCQKPSIIEVVGTDEEVECASRNGPFVLTRRPGNLYRCGKTVPLGSRGDVLFVYGHGDYSVQEIYTDVRKTVPLGSREDVLFVYGLGDYRRYDHPPTLCEVCTGPGKWEHYIYIVHRHGQNKTRGQLNKMTHKQNILHCGTLQTPLFHQKDEDILNNRRNAPLMFISLQHKI